ncbi:MULTISPECIES: hypothetical protein [Arthrobacter]|uniref:Cell division protein FtsL n=2 Tax=Arthrobacter TaxID=1663 RepID=A0ABU9KH38_9MICC|nr:hypothetical protein [Arthrobacter sp. YJM1]MDP5226209.1 hypothetical protein [Arthrobacter sp. YJM1]
MSSVNNRMTASSIGNTARKLAAPAPAKERRRTPLVVVPAAPRRRSLMFVISCFTVLAAALVGVLTLNIQLSEGQYAIVNLKAQQSSLSKSNQELTQQVQNFSAPQNLAAKAGALGMVPSAGQGQIDLDNLTVTGKAVAAVKDPKSGLVQIAAPEIAGQLSVVTALPDQQPGQAQAPETKTKPVAPAAPEVPKVQLNGGSVPAPAQRTPGN